MLFPNRVCNLYMNFSLSKIRKCLYSVAQLTQFHNESVDPNYLT